MSIEQFEKSSGRVERERPRESREVKEVEVDPELAKAATMERAEYLVKEVKSSKQQMQNIVQNISQVKKLIKQLRAQLALADDDDISSVTRDEDAIRKLRTSIAEHAGELEMMREDLVRFTISDLAKSAPEATVDTLEREARRRVDEMLGEIKN
jgi:hypothetical protein